MEALEQSNRALLEEIMQCHIDMKAMKTSASPQVPQKRY
jgi:hypothetical protein